MVTLEKYNEFGKSGLKKLVTKIWRLAVCNS